MTRTQKERILEIKQKMKELAEDKYPDIERAHSCADDLLCELLSIIGHGDMVNDFEELEKWYS